jgi:hypothetical protein
MQTAIEHKNANPLNPLLFSMLEHRFGEVRIANEGVPAMIKSLKDPLNPGRILRSGSWGEYYCICCPFCNDDRHKLWVNHLYGAELDPKTGRRKDTYLATCYKNNCLNDHGKREQFEDMVFGLNKRRLPKMHIKHVEVAARTAVDDVGETVSLTELPEHHPAIEYLRERSFEPAELAEQFGVGVCLNPSQDRYRIMRGRIYIPITFNGKLVGWQGRAVGNADKTVKYYNAPGTPKSQLLYNYDQAINEPIVIVVEGVPSVWRLGKAAVCIFGKTLSWWQQNTLVTGWTGKPVFVMFDNDAAAETEKAVHLLTERGANVVPVFLPDNRDPADYTRAELFEILSSAASAVGVSADLSSLM